MNEGNEDSAYCITESIHIKYTELSNNIIITHFIEMTMTIRTLANDEGEPLQSTRPKKKY